MQLFEESLRKAIINSTDAKKSSRIRRAWFSRVRRLHALRSPDTIKRMEAAWL